MVFCNQGTKPPDNIERKIVCDDHLAEKPIQLPLLSRLATRGEINDVTDGCFDSVEDSK